jgi:hypothetical protein
LRSFRDDPQLIPRKNQMAKTGATDNKRDGAVKQRSQVQNTTSKLWTKRDKTNGEFMDTKTGGGKFKGVTREGLPTTTRTQAAVRTVRKASRIGKKATNKAAPTLAKTAGKKGARKSSATK